VCEILACCRKDNYGHSRNSIFVLQNIARTHETASTGCFQSTGEIFTVIAFEPFIAEQLYSIKIRGKVFVYMSEKSGKIR